jgi:hypothetical protein
MSMNVVQGGESKYRIEEYIFTPSTTTDKVYEGYAVCFNYDAVDDYQNETTTEQTFTRAAVTLAEGSQDFDARVRTVEKPAASNLHAFAGIVHRSSDGASNGDTIKVMVPINGVIPCHTDLNCVNGQTLFAIKSGSYNITDPVYGGSTTPFRVIGVAAETIDRSSTAGLCLGRIGPEYGCQFEGCGVTANNLQVGSASSSGTLIAKFFSVETIQTGGDFSAIRLRGEIAGAGANGGLGAGARIEGVVNSTTVGSTCGASIHLIFKTGATGVASNLYEGAYIKAENQDATPAALASAKVQAIRLVTQLNEDPGEHAMIRFETEGSDKPDYLFTAKDINAIAGAVSVSNAPALATGDIMCKVQIDTGTGAGDWYIPLMADSGQ